MEGPALTALAAGELGRSTHVAYGTVTALRDVRGMAIAHVAVERWLRGTSEAPTITVMVGGPRPSLDKQNPSLPLLERRVGVTYVLFLAQRAEGEAFALENRLVIEGLEGTEKVRAVEAQIALALIPRIEERGRRVLQHFLAALEGQGTWTRSNAARELNHLAQVRPEAFTLAARAQIARAAEGPASPTVRAWLRALDRRLQALPPPPAGPVLAPDTGLAPQPRMTEPVPTPAATSSAPSAEAEQTLARLDALLVESATEAPNVALHLLRRLEEVRQRVFVIDWLAAGGYVEALVGLRACYAREEEPEVRAAVIRAHGSMGGEADVPWLRARLGNATLVEAVMLALARIGTPAARGALEAFRDERSRGGEEDQELARKVEQLLSPAFEEAERACAGRPGADPSEQPPPPKQPQPPGAPPAEGSSPR